MEEVENVNEEIAREEALEGSSDNIGASTELRQKHQEVETDDFQTMLEQSKPSEPEEEGEKPIVTELEMDDGLNGSQNNDIENKDVENQENSESQNNENNDNNEEMVEQDQEEEQGDESPIRKKKNKKEKKSKKEKKKKDDKKKKNKKDPESNSVAKSLAHDIFGSSDEEDNAEKEDDELKQNDEDDDLFDDVDEEESKEKLKRLANKKKSEKRKKREKDQESKKKRKRSGGDENEENPENQEEGEGEIQYEDEKVTKEKGFFDEFIDSMKSGRASGRRKKKSEDEIRETHNLVEDFKVKMDIAMEDDRLANQQGKPALKKLMMITEVCNTLEKKNLQMTFVENDILGTIKKWLEPLPDKSLPNIKIRENLLRVLLKFPPIETEDLRDSGIGKVIMFLSKHPLESAPNKKAAQQLIERWSRPIFGISEKFKDMDTVYDADFNNDNTVQDTGYKTNASFDLSAELEKNSNKRREVIPVKDSPTYHARIPEKIALDFKIRPKSKVSAENTVKKTKRTIEKNLNQKKAALVPGRGMIRRAIPISIEGRNMAH